jgi:hypothetical protein
MREARGDEGRETDFTVGYAKISSRTTGKQLVAKHREKNGCFNGKKIKSWAVNCNYCNN